MIKTELLLGIIGTGTGVLSFLWLIYKHVTERSELNITVLSARRIVKREDDLYGSKSTKFRINLQVVNAGRLPTCIRKTELNIQTERLKKTLTPVRQTRLGLIEGMGVYGLTPYMGENLDLTFFLEDTIIDATSFPCEIVLYNAENKPHKVKFFSKLSDQ